MVRPAEQTPGGSPDAGSDARVMGRRGERREVAAGLVTALSSSGALSRSEKTATDALMPLAFPHVVVMDSNLDVLDRLGRMLHQFSLSVTMVSNVLDLQTLKRIAPNVIVLGISGDVPLAARDVLRQLRSDAQASRIPVISCVAAADMLELSEQGEPQRRAGQLQTTDDFDDIVATILGEIMIQEFHHGIHVYD